MMNHKIVKPKFRSWTSPYRRAKRMGKDVDYCKKQYTKLLISVNYLILNCQGSLKELDTPDKTIKQQISLLSSLLDVKRKLRVEQRELSQESEKPEESLRELLSRSKN